MINCNPETVSTDYDTANRLYFESLTCEDVLEIIRVESTNGILHGTIVQLGGQTPLNLSRSLVKHNIAILGTSPAAIELAEDRQQFSQLLQRHNIRQTESGFARNAIAAKQVAARIGYPVMVRPSYVLGGRAMAVVYDEKELDLYITSAAALSDHDPILIDRFLTDAIEIDVDAIADGSDVFIAGIMEHLEMAGVHSGDSACSLPPYSLSENIIAGVQAQTIVLARAVGVIGLMNVQFAVQDNIIYVLEVNPRAARTVPFVAKATGAPVAKIAARVIAGEKLKDILPQYAIADRNYTHIAVKEVVFPFARFAGSDSSLGPEMRSTGEVMGIDYSFDLAFAKAQEAASMKLPSTGSVLLISNNKDAKHVHCEIENLISWGFKVIVNKTCGNYWKMNNIPVIIQDNDEQQQIVDLLKSGEVKLVLHLPGRGFESLVLERAELMSGAAFYTTLSEVKAVVRAIGALRNAELAVRSLQFYTDK